MGIVVRRIQQAALSTDGMRVLVERRWPRGLRTEDAALDGWLRELAPSTALWHWFGCDPARWEGFRHRYAAELDRQEEHWRPLASRSLHHRLTLLHATRDEEHNQALALKIYLDSWIRGHGPR